MGLRLSDIKKISGKSGLNFKKIRRRSDMAVLWAAEEYPFADGVLADGLSLSGFTILDNTLYYHLSQGGDEDGTVPKTGEAVIIGLDLTGYDYLDFSAILSFKSIWSDGDYCKYGIDTADNVLGTNTGGGPGDDAVITGHDKTLDVSAYSGVHNLVFECCVHACTTHSGYIANLNLNIDTIKLHNEEG